MEALFILVLALCLDLIFGEPPTALHPVGWLGRFIALSVNRAPKENRLAQLGYGAVVVVAGIGVYGLVSYLIISLVAQRSSWASLILAALLFKSSFSVRELLNAGVRVKVRLMANDLLGARTQLRALVSRDTTQLGPGGVAAAAIESLAENTVDSFIAPVFYFALLAPLGPIAVTAALCYRAANTLDAMIGYRGRFEYLGKVAARLDDVLSWLPARVGTLCLILAALCLGGWKGACLVLARDRDKTESPNAGWTISAMAGALGVTLEKVGHYALGDGPLPGPTTIDRAARLALAASLLFAAACAIILSVTA